MTHNEAIELAIEALEEDRDDTYEGEELDDPDIQAWQQKRSDAIDILTTLKV